jgi:hypothetical protein
MATPVQNASAIMDALADHKGLTLDAARKLDLAQKFTRVSGTNEEIATAFLDFWHNAIKTTVRSHAHQDAGASYDAAVDAAADSEVSDL